MNPSLIKNLSENKIDKEKLKELVYSMPLFASQLTLQQFCNIFIYRFDSEAEIKRWKATEFQTELDTIWENNSKSCVLAPREHLKTSSVLNYIIKKVYTRKYPLEINYYHLNNDLAYEKFGKLLRIIESNPLLKISFRPEKAKKWTQRDIKLYDGTIIKPLSYQQGVIGKHPQIIVMDDIIDSTVLYSDLQNRKSIHKFYSDIYPMISKDEPDRKIIMIGTAQRKDDLYHSLPDDFVLKVFQAVISDGQKQVLSPEIFTYENLMGLKGNISAKYGEKFWLKEYMNIPFEAMGLIIKPEWIQYYYKVPPKDRLLIYQGWDLSVGKDLEKGDWTVGITLGVDRNDYQKIKYYVLDVFRARLPFAGRLDAVVNVYHKWKPNIIGIEENAFQYDTVQTLINKTGLPINGIQAYKHKIETFQTELAPYFENRLVYIKEEMQELKQELLSLPVGSYDDQADALKIAIKTVLMQPPTAPFEVPIVTSKPFTAGWMDKKW